MPATQLVVLVNQGRVEAVYVDGDPESMEIIVVEDDGAKNVQGHALTAEAGGVLDLGAAPDWLMKACMFDGGA